MNLNFLPLTIYRNWDNSLILFGHEILTLSIIWIAVFIAGIIRGYSGFGFAMVAVTSMSLVLPPAQVVPVVLILEVLASIRLIPQVWRKIDWYSLRWLLTGSFFAIPVGVYFLATIPADPMRIFISLLVLIAAILLLSGWAWRRMPGRTLILTTGVGCGLLNGAAAIGGPPVIIFYLSSPAGVAVSRASIIAYFLGIDVISLVMASIQGLTTLETFQLTAIALVPLLLGISMGSRMFKNVNEKAFRQHVLILLIILAVIGLLKGIS